MKLALYDDPKAFKAEAGDFLIEDECANAIALGAVESVIQSYAENGKISEFTYLGLIRNGDRVEGVLVMTKRTPLLLCQISSMSLPLIVEFAASLPQPLRSVMGRTDVIESFLELWERQAGIRHVKRLNQAVFQISKVTHTTLVPPGHMVQGDAQHLDQVLEWNRAFLVESGLQSKDDSIWERRRVERAIAEASIFLWVRNGVPTSMVWTLGKTPNGMRIGTGYTPKAHRGQGYGMALVAHLSQWLLDRGYKHCFLSTDLFNSTTNKIYPALGYQKRGEVCLCELG